MNEPTPVKREELTLLGKRVVADVSMLWVRRTIFRRIVPVALILLATATLLAQLVFWSHVFENFRTVANSGHLGNYLLLSFEKTTAFVQILLIGGTLVTLLFLRSLWNVMRRILAHL